MDSNFSVKITADISELQSRLAAVEAITGKFSQSMDKAAGSVRNMEQNTNRGRMVAFAFGQVIRDAGFFSQSFSLGILAISNNVPILIDQLSLSVKALQPFAGALSLIGSILTAGLTVWAYSTQAVKANRESIEDWRKSLNDATESQLRGTQAAQEEIVKLDYLYKVATSAANSTKTRTQAAKQLQELYPTIFGNLSTESIMLGEVSGRYQDLRTDILAAAAAQAALNKIVENSSRIQDNNIRILETKSKIQRLSAELSKETAIAERMQAAADKSASSMTGGGAQADFFGKVRDIKSQILRLTKEISDAETDTKILDTRNDVLKSLAQEETAAKAVTQSWAGYNKETEKAARNRDNVSSKLYGRDTLNEFQKLIFQPIKNKPVVQVDLVPKKKLGVYEMEQLENFVLYMREVEAQINDIFINGIAATIGNAMMAVGEAFATGGNVGRAFGKTILGSLSSVLSQFGDMLIAASLAGLKFSTALKNLFDTKSWGIALAAGIALKVAAGALSGFSKNPTSGVANVAQTSSSSGGGFNSMGMGPIYNRPTITGIGLSGETQPVLETRVSGNDLVILMNRANKNRNGYY